MRDPIFSYCSKTLVRWEGFQSIDSRNRQSFLKGLGKRRWMSTRRKNSQNVHSHIVVIVLKFDSPEIPEGSDPVREFPTNLKSTRSDMFPISEGRVPPRLASPTLNRFSFVSAPHSAGMVAPFKRFLSKLRSSRDWRFPNSVGIVPVKSFVLTSKRRRLRLGKLEGNGPSKWLLLPSNTPKFVKVSNWNVKFPPKRLEEITKD
mmetsp:Transcript_17363/g.40315  ORF Transcript_17363/g.40315 Transcript_17363/m.40315 type:complete len:203 (+) Transcript_17363:17-625(+)